MTLTLAGQTEIKCDGNIFHELFRSKPHEISSICPDKIQGCKLVHGGFGTVGCEIFWNYTNGGKARVARETYAVVDIGKKLITFNVIEGDLLELYKSFSITVQVEHKAQTNIVTWTFDYEKLSDDIPAPTFLMDFCLAVTKDIDVHKSKK